MAKITLSLAEVSALDEAALAAKFKEAGFKMVPDGTERGKSWLLEHGFAHNKATGIVPEPVPEITTNYINNTITITQE